MKVQKWMLRYCVFLLFYYDNNAQGREYLSDTKWQKMSTNTMTDNIKEYFGNVRSRISRELHDQDHIRVLWLSFTLFFTVGGYWLLRSLKDPIISTIDGVDRIPQAKILSLFVVFALVVVCKLHDVALTSIN